MASFSATDAGLVGFKVARDNPMAVVAWALLSLVSLVITSVIMASLAGPAMEELKEFTGKAAEVDPQAMLAIYARLAPAFLLILPLSLIFSGIMYAAANRLVLKPADGSFGGLKLGNDEFRQIWVLVLVFLVIIAVYLALVLGVVVIAALGAVINPILGGLLAVLAGLAALAALIWVSLRLSLIGPIAFATGKVGLSGSWNMTKGHVWPLLGAYVLAVVMGVIVSVLVMAIFFGFAALAFGFKEAGAVVMNPDMSSLAALASPLMITYFLVNSVTSALTSMIFLCPAAVIYQQLRGTGAEVFD
jgi:hypothetical protein